MNILLEPHKQVLRSLVDFKVDFILIGGYAVNYHGYNRTTGDMDIWLKPDNENRANFIKFLERDGFDAESLAKISETDFTKHIAFHVGEKPLQIDFVTFISGVSFSEAEKEKQLLPFEDIFIPFLHLNHLILSKITSNRLKDKMDVEELQKVMKFKKKE